MSMLLAVLSISFVKPLSPACHNTLCNDFYTPTPLNVRPTSCNCNETTHAFIYPPGYTDLHISYNLTYPVSHDFYQNRTLIDSCPEGVVCNQYVTLDPKYEVMTLISECENFSNTDNDNNQYDLSFYSFSL